MILIKKGDITEEDVDVIVNAANEGLRGGGGVDGAIHRAAGTSVMTECHQIGHCPTGQAVITAAGNLKAQKIIHTVGPVWRGGNQNEAHSLRQCYENTFRLAREHTLKTIALPAISTGVYNYPLSEAARIALTIGLTFQDYFSEIRYICFSEKDLATYQDIWQDLQT